MYKHKCLAAYNNGIPHLGSQTSVLANVISYSEIMPRFGVGVLGCHSIYFEYRKHWPTKFPFPFWEMQKNFISHHAE